MLDYEDVYRAALNKWGREGQYDQAVEECAELIAAIKHFRRGRIQDKELIEELADVVLMVGQLIYMLGPDRIEKAVEKKIGKLRRLLAGP